MLAAVLNLGLALQSITPEAVQHAQAGLAAQKAGQLDQAIVEFQKVTELLPTLPAAFVNLGNAYLQKHDYGGAVAPLKRAVELNPDLPGAQQMLGTALLASGYNNEAVEHFQKAQDAGLLGIAQVEAGSLADAIPNLQAALSKQPDNPDLLYYLGRATSQLSKNSFDTLLSTHPEAARTHQLLAENHAVLRQVPEAEREYREAFRLRPDTPGLHLEIGELYGTAGRWPEAEKEFRAEATLQPGNAEAAYRLGAALLQNGKVKEAEVQLARSNDLRGDMPETLYSLGKAASLTNNPALAEKSWKAVLAGEKEGPLAAQSHFGLATLYRKQGRTAEAGAEMKAFQTSQKPHAEGR